MNDTMRDLLSRALGDDAGAGFPFSLVYDGNPFRGEADAWARSEDTVQTGAGVTKTTVTFLHKPTSLRVTWESIHYEDFQALDWVVFYENVGAKDTPIIEDVLAMDLTFAQPLVNVKSGYWPAKTIETEHFAVEVMAGTKSDPSEFAMETLQLSRGHGVTLCHNEGRLNRGNTPFLKLETGCGSVILAIGWSGNWKVDLQTDDACRLRACVGLEKTHFRLHPGERVRGPRVLMAVADNHGLDINRKFRQLILKHYVPKFQGREVEPVLYCNSAYSRNSGFWLNECNAENQVSLIKALKGLGLQVFLTDAGWFDGLWGDGVGNWTLRKDAYPDGIAPVAGAAREASMLYGFWFEPERVVEGTKLHREHPDWLLPKKSAYFMEVFPMQMFLLKMWLPEVREYLVNIVSGFMKTPGFNAYRQDINQPFPDYCRPDLDDPDRVGVTEMKYVAGLYEYWDMLMQRFPDSYREVCWRLDLEAVKRFHVHQKSDCVHDLKVNQTTNFNLSHYLPNAIFYTVNRGLDDYSFHSAMASSLNFCPVADAKGFPRKRAKELTALFREVRPLLNGDWYPLTDAPAGMSATVWLASQYHRPDLNRGVVFAYRREFSQEQTLLLKLQGLNPDAPYGVEIKGHGVITQARGTDLMKGFEVLIPETPGSRVIVYRPCGDHDVSAAG